MRFSSSPLNGATSTLWLRANCISWAASAFASCSVENIAVTWRASSLPNTTDSIRARQTRSVIASVRTTLFSVFIRLVKLLPVPMREVCQLPTISTQVRTDSKLKRPQRRADAWKQNGGDEGEDRRRADQREAVLLPRRADVEVAHEDERHADRGEHQHGRVEVEQEQGAVARRRRARR